MNWQIFSLLSCLLWGTSSILIARVAKTQSGLVTFAIYSGATFITGIVAIMINQKPLMIEKTSVPTVFVAGICSGIAMLFQVLALVKWQEKLPWIALIGSLYPIVVISYVLLSGQKFTVVQWIGTVLGILSIVLIGLADKIKM